MKKILLLIAIASLFACNSKAQNTTVEGALTSYGTNTTLTNVTADTVYFKGAIPATGDLTLSVIFSSGTTSGHTITGVGTLWVSMDGATYTLYPTRSTSDSSTFTLSAQATSLAPPIASPAVSTGVYSYTKLLMPTYLTSVATSGSITKNGNPFKYYMVRFISTTATSVASGTLTVGVRYICRRNNSAY